MTDDDTDPDDLDAELCRLFADDRLGVTPAPGAGHRIVAGARRRRRRRTMVAATAATAVVIAFAAGGLALSRPGVPPSPSDVRAAAPSTSDNITYSAYAVPRSPSPLPPRQTAPWEEPTATVRPHPVETPSTSPSATPSPPTSPPMASAEIMLAPPVLGPDGYKELKLGMPFPDAAKTGLLVETETPPPAEGCVAYRLTEGSGAIHDVTISGTRGIVDFRASGARTAEGIAVGSPVDALRNAYPDLTTDAGGYSAAAGGGRYVFTAAADTVTEVHLVAAEREC